MLIIKQYHHHHKTDRRYSYHCFRDPSNAIDIPGKRVSFVVLSNWLLFASVCSISETFEALNKTFMRPVTGFKQRIVTFNATRFDFGVHEFSFVYCRSKYFRDRTKLRLSILVILYLYIYIYIYIYMRIIHIYFTNI